MNTVMATALANTMSHSIPQNIGPPFDRKFGNMPAYIRVKAQSSRFKVHSGVELCPLNSFRLDAPLLKPRDPEQVNDPAPQPVPKAVFGNARHAWPVVHRDFANLRPAAVGQDR